MNKIYKIRKINKTIIYYKDKFYLLFKVDNK